MVRLCPAMTCIPLHGQVDSTCGVAMDLNGGIIPDSQGRCCSCSVGSQLGLDSIDSNMVRGQLDCALFGTGQASAHCLRFDPLWYNVYRIKAPMVRARIYTTVLQRAEASTTQTQVRCPRRLPATLDPVAGGGADVLCAGARPCSCVDEYQA